MPLDFFKGELTDNGKKEGEVKGSVWEFLSFDNEMYWELETSNLWRPHTLDDCLPSDSKYRTDCIAFASGDLEQA